MATLVQSDMDLFSSEYESNDDASESEVERGPIFTSSPKTAPPGVSARKPYRPFFLREARRCPAK